MQKLDQSLSLKCSKSVLSAKVHELEESLFSIKKAKALEAKVIRAENLVRERDTYIQQQIEAYKQVLGNDVAQMMDDKIHAKLEEYEHVVAQFKGFFNMEDINFTLQNKANVAQVQDLEQRKVSGTYLLEIDKKMK